MKIIYKILIHKPVFYLENIKTPFMNLTYINFNKKYFSKSSLENAFRLLCWNENTVKVPKREQFCSVGVNNRKLSVFQCIQILGTYLLSLSKSIIDFSFLKRDTKKKNSICQWSLPVSHKLSSLGLSEPRRTKYNTR